MANYHDNVLSIAANENDMADALRRMASNLDAFLIDGDEYGGYTAIHTFVATHDGRAPLDGLSNLYIQMQCPTSLASGRDRCNKRPR